MTTPDKITASQNRLIPDRTHFARLLTLAQVVQSMEMLESICDGQLADLMTGSFQDGFVKVHAPDGDIVFAALEKAPDAWACRFHREVFEE